jgi:hypothetical protein
MDLGNENIEWSPSGYAAHTGGDKEDSFGPSQNAFNQLEASHMSPGPQSQLELGQNTVNRADLAIKSHLEYLSSHFLLAMYSANKLSSRTFLTTHASPSWTSRLQASTFTCPGIDLERAMIVAVAECKVWGPWQCTIVSAEATVKEDQTSAGVWVVLRHVKVNMRELVSFLQWRYAPRRGRWLCYRMKCLGGPAVLF